MKHNTRGWANIIFGNAGYGFLWGALIGLVCYILIFGVKLLDVHYTDWILQYGDMELPYFGWNYYHTTDGGVFSQIEGLTWPYTLSPIFMDMDLIMASILKLFGSLIPDNIQYLGILEMINVCLLCGFGFILIKRITGNLAGSILGTIFLCISPWFLQRCLYHVTLSAQWLIIAGLCLWCFKKELKNKVYFFWFLLITVSSMIHIYFVPILGMLCVCSFIKEIFVDRKVIKVLLTGAASFAASVGIVALYGGFSCNLSDADQSWSYSVLGEINANLNCFVDSQGYSSFLPDLDNTYTYQPTEGMAYLGLGLLLLILVDIVLLFQKRNEVKQSLGEHKVEFAAIFLCFVGFFVCAVGNRITFCGRELVVLPLPQFFVKLLATFRSQGRWIWVPCYLILLGSLAVLYRYGSKGKRGLVTGIAAVLLVVQIIDLGPFLQEKHQYAGERVVYDSLLKDEKWEKLAQDHEVVIAITANMTSHPNEQMLSMTRYVLEHDLKISSTYIAHQNETLYDASMEFYHDLLSGIPIESAIYWFETEDMMDEASQVIHCEVLDGFYVGWVER